MPAPEYGLDGPSVRTLHLKLDDTLKDESDQDDEVASISGTHNRTGSEHHCKQSIAVDAMPGLLDPTITATHWDKSVVPVSDYVCNALIG